MSVITLIILAMAGLVIFIAVTVDMPTSGKICMLLVYLLTASCMWMVCRPYDQPNHRKKDKDEEDNRR